MHELREKLVPIIEELENLRATAVTHTSEAGKAAIASGSAADAEHELQRAQAVMNYLHAATEAIRAVVQTVDYRERDLKNRAEAAKAEAEKKLSLEQQLGQEQAVRSQLESELAVAQAEVRTLRADAAGIPRPVEARAPAVPGRP